MSGLGNALLRSLVSGTAGMPASRRRRADAVLLAVAVAAVGVIALAGAVVGNNERITGLWTSAEISSDGTARVTEVIDYDFGWRNRHGIYRDVPGLAPNAAVTVTSATAPDVFELVNMGSVTRIRIGDPYRTISGRHRYRIQYPLQDLAPGGKLAWDAVGTGWPVKVSDIEIHVASPFELAGVRCMQGPAGSTQPCEVAQPEPGHVVGRIGTLGAGKGATLYGNAASEPRETLRLPAPPAGAAPDAGVSPLVPGLLAAAVALVVAAVASRLARRGGRERVTAAWPADAGRSDDGEAVRVDSAKLASSRLTSLGPPPELTPAQGGIVLAEGVNEEHKVAWLISAATDGYLDIEGDGGYPSLVRRPPAGASPPDLSTVSVLDQAFGGHERLTLGTYSPGFAAAWQRLGVELANWQSTCGLWDPAGDRRCRLAQWLGVLAAAAGLILTFIGGGAAVGAGGAWPELVMLGAALAGTGLALVIRAWELRVRTPHGCTLWQQVESFRRLLAESGALQADQATEGGRLGQYTAWAVALGEMDGWSRAVAASTVAASSHPLMPMYGQWTARTLSSATSASSTAPSSDGGSGGAGSGGGGGGGGGGSW